MASAAPDFAAHTELSADKVGGKILFATDEWFAAASDVIKYDEPVWKEGLFTEQGKWMDGWESRRKRTAGHDWCIIQLGIPGVVKGITVDTAFFTGNNSPRTSIEFTDDDGLAARLPAHSPARGQKASDAAIAQGTAAVESVEWATLLPMTPLQPGYPDTRKHHFAVDSAKRWKYAKLSMYPDGGIARCRVYGVVQPDWALHAGQSVDLAAVTSGGTAHSWSDTHYGHPSLLLNPGRGVDMGDGWETARRKDRPPIYTKDGNGHLVLPGSEWCILKLGTQGCVNKVEVDTAHFKGNFPESFRLEACRSVVGAMGLESLEGWFDLVPRSKLAADDIAFFPIGHAAASKPITHVRLRIFPDGGISRLRLWGTPTQGSKL
jgi:allantoicase